MWHSRVINTIYEIDESSWDNVAGGQPQLSHAWQRVTEASGRSYKPEYVLLFDDAELVAFAICPGVQSWQLANPLARRLLEASTLLSSSPTSTLHTGLAVRNDGREAQTLNALLDALRDNSYRRRRLFQALSSVNALSPPSLEQLAPHGFQSRALMDGTYLPICWTSFLDYRQSLGRKHNQEIRSYQRRAREMGVTVSRGRQFAAHGEQLYRLLLNVHRSHYPPNTPFLIGPNVFEALQRERPPNTELILVSVEDQIVAFSLCQFGNGLMVFGPWLGLDYERSRDTYAYFLLYYEVIQAAMDYGCSNVYAGLGTYDIKGRLGFKTVPRYFCLRGRSRWLALLLSWAFETWKRNPVRRAHLRSPTEEKLD